MLKIGYIKKKCIIKRCKKSLEYVDSITKWLIIALKNYHLKHNMLYTNTPNSKKKISKQKKG